jgi:hypothetical protein
LALMDVNKRPKLDSPLVGLIIMTMVPTTIYIEIGKIPSGKYQLRFTINKTDLIHNTTEPLIVEVNIDHENEKGLD